MEDRGRRRVEVACDPPAYAVPEGVEDSQGLRVGCQEVSAIGGNGQQEALGHPVHEEGADTGTWGGQPFHKEQGGFGQGQTACKGLLGVEGGSEPEA